MKPSCIPIALVSLLAVSTAASAQSRLSVYGRMDLGIRYAPDNLVVSSARDWTVSSGSTARIGFRGEEVLTPDLSANFRFEHRFKADTGEVDGSPFWKQVATVGLTSKAYGTVFVGRMMSPQDYLGVSGRFEAFDGDTYAASVTRGARAAAKWDNSVFYISPRIGGFTVHLAAAAGEGIRRRAEGFMLEYARGPLTVAMTHSVEQDPVAGAGAGNAVATTTLAGNYVFGAVIPMFTYGQSEDTGASDEGRERVLTVGARIPAGPGEIRLSVRRLRDDRLNGVNHALDTASDRLGLGYQYRLSKLTSLNLCLVNDRLETFNADGSSKSDRTGRGFELTLRQIF